MTEDTLLTLADVVEATGASVTPPAAQAHLAERPVRGVSTDTRTLRPGDVFVALRGPRVDGHQFVGEAIACGAAAVMVSSSAAVGVYDPAHPVLLVSDTLAALGAIAAAHRAGLNAQVVGITGSVGKTTTTAFTAAVLEQRFQTVRSEEGWNAEIGVPLTLLRAGPRTEVVVAEMAMRGEGQISHLVAMARPRLGVVTNIAEAHLGLLGSLEAIARAKGELIEGLPPDGVAVLNADDPYTPSLAARAGCRVITFGEAPRAEVRGSDPLPRGEALAFALHCAGGRRSVRAPLPGRHTMANALAAAAVGYALEVPLEDIARGIEHARGPVMRLQVEEIGGTLIVNDAYNSGPRSLRAALDALDDLAAGRRRILVLGDMRELGGASADLHRRAGREAGGRSPAAIIAVGPEAAALAEGAREVLPVDRVAYTRDREEAARLLDAMVRPGDVVLVKGSRALGLEALVEKLRTRPPAPMR